MVVRAVLQFILCFLACDRLLFLYVVFVVSVMLMVCFCFILKYRFGNIEKNGCFVFLINQKEVHLHCN